MNVITPGRLERDSIFRGQLAIFLRIASMPSQHSQNTQRPNRPASSLINVVFVILIPILAGVILFILGPGLDKATALFDRIPTPWTNFSGEQTSRTGKMSNTLNGTVLLSREFVSANVNFSLQEAPRSFQYETHDRILS
jgi:hypothetical protein